MPKLLIVDVEDALIPFDPLAIPPSHSYFSDVEIAV